MSSYDPDRTRVMPRVSSEYPITDEYPAVPPLKRSSNGRFLLQLITGLVLVGMAAIVVIVLVRQEMDEPASSDEPVAEGDATPGAPTATPVDVEPITELPDDQTGYWQVTGVPDGLNVRAEPGTDSEIIGALLANQRGVFATGVRVSVKGAEWRQIVFGDDDRTGWVSARFLAADSAPVDNGPTSTPASDVSVVCFGSEGDPELVARIEFTNRSTINGVLRAIDADADTVVTAAVTGELRDGGAAVTLSNSTSGQVERQEWVFNTTNVRLGDGTTMDVVNCATIADQLGE